MMEWLLGFILLIVKLAVMLGVLLLVASYLVWLERKLLARLQIRWAFSACCSRSPTRSSC